MTYNDHYFSSGARKRKRNKSKNKSKKTNKKRRKQRKKIILNSREEVNKLFSALSSPLQTGTQHSEPVIHERGNTWGINFQGRNFEIPKEIIDKHLSKVFEQIKQNQINTYLDARKETRDLIKQLERLAERPEIKTYRSSVQNSFLNLFNKYQKLMEYRNHLYIGLSKEDKKVLKEDEDDLDFDMKYDLYERLKKVNADIEKDQEDDESDDESDDKKSHKSNHQSNRAPSHRSNRAPSHQSNRAPSHQSNHSSHQSNHSGSESRERTREQSIHPRHPKINIERINAVRMHTIDREGSRSASRSYTMSREPSRSRSISQYRDSEPETRHRGDQYSTPNISMPRRGSVPLPTSGLVNHSDYDRRGSVVSQHHVRVAPGTSRVGIDNVGEANAQPNISSGASTVAYADVRGSVPNITSGYTYTPRVSIPEARPYIQRTAGPMPHEGKVYSKKELEMLEEAKRRIDRYSLKYPAGSDIIQSPEDRKDFIGALKLRRLIQNAPQQPVLSPEQQAHQRRVRDTPIDGGLDIRFRRPLTSRLSTTVPIPSDLDETPEASGSGRRHHDNVQAVLFDKLLWTPEQAKKWISKHHFKPIKKVHETNNLLRYRIKQPQKYHKYRVYELPGTRKSIKFILEY